MHEETRASIDHNLRMRWSDHGSSPCEARWDESSALVDGVEVGKRISYSTDGEQRCPRETALEIGVGAAFLDAIPLCDFHRTPYTFSWLRPATVERARAYEGA